MKTEKWFFMKYLLSAIWRRCFHHAKFDNFKDETMSDCLRCTKQKLAGMKPCSWLVNF